LQLDELLLGAGVRRQAEGGGEKHEGENSISDIHLSSVLLDGFLRDWG
jgi:hypothetical protein